MSRPRPDSFAWTLLAITLAALALRLWRLPALGGFDWDEAATVFIAQRSLPDLLAYVRAAPFEHPPLYYALAHVWLGLGRDESILRLLSVLLGTAAVPLLGLLGARVFGRTVGLSAAALLALAPAHVFFSRDARMYPLLTLLGLLGAYALVRALRAEAGRGRGWWVLWALSGLAALATHYFAVFPLLGQGLWLAWERRGRGGRRLALGGAALVAVVAAAWWLLSPGLRHSLGALRLAPPPPAELAAQLGGALADLLRGPLGGDARAVEQVTTAATLALMVAAGLGLTRQRGGGLGLLVALGLLPLIALAGLTLLGRELPVRYLVPVLPYVLLATAAGWAVLWPGRRGWGALAAAWALVAVPWLSTYYVEYWRGDYAQAMRAAEERARPGDIAVLNGPWQRLLWDHYDGHVLPAYILTGAVPLAEGQVSAALADATRGRRAVWLFEADLGRADPDGYVGSWLARYAYRDETWRYRQVAVTRYLLDGAEAPNHAILERETLGVDLVAAGLAPPSVGPGGEARLALVWRVREDFDPGLKVSVRLWGSDGARWWRADPWLLEGWIAARRPQPGDLLHNRLVVTLPDAAPSGPYQLEALVYRSTERPESGEGWVAWNAVPIRIPLDALAPGELAAARALAEP